MRHLSSLVLALGIGCAVFDGSVFAPSALSRTTSDVALKLRRSPGRVDVVINGLGMNARAVSQRSTNDRWTARLTDVDLGDDPFVPQQVLFEASELLSVRLEPLDGDLKLIVKARIGETVPMPQISSDGNNLIVTFTGLVGPTMRSRGRLDLRSPGRVPQPVAVPPMRPRAVAPPVGDMAVGTMLINNRSFVQASGPSVTLTLNNAPAKDTLMSLARLGGYGFVYIADSYAVEGSVIDAAAMPVTMAFRNERFDRALNSVLMASGLQARLDGKTLLVGTDISAEGFGPRMSKVFRLNQVDVASASRYLGNLGASIQVTATTTTTSQEGDSEDGSSNDSGGGVSSVSESSSVETYSAEYGPLLGLVGTTDNRLNTITLVGDPQIISVAESYLKQIDLRKRQVAVKVQILNVSLTNDKSVDASFSARMGDTYIVSQSGKAHMNFGRYKPGNISGTGVYQDGEYGTPGAYQAGISDVEAQQVVDPFVQQQRVNPPYVEAQEKNLVTDEDGNTTVQLTPLLDDLGRPIYVPSTNPNAEPDMVPLFDVNGQPINVPSTDPTAAQTLKPVYDKNGRPVYVQGQDPSKFRHPDDSFFAYIESLIVSSSAKTLAQPTLLVQEGESAAVETGENVITGVSSTETANGSTQFENTRENAGLNLQVSVNKIDDNGFVTLSLNPEISVPIPAGVQQGVPIFNIAARKLDSGDVRLRDGQSLILTGVISESDREQVRKWPILGDMPLIGQLFRQTASSREKNELVVIVTPMVLDDEQGGRFGYSYRPGTSSGRQLMQSGF